MYLISIDYESLEESDFKESRGLAIYAKYFQHGGTHQLPVGIVEIEKIEGLILSYSGKHLPSNIFESTKLDVMYYVILFIIFQFLFSSREIYIAK